MRVHRPKWMQPTAVEYPTAWTLCVFAFLYLTCVVYVRQYAWRDPTSIFFQPKSAYTPRYSDVRLQQTHEFLEDSRRHPRAGRNNETVPEICIGIPTIARKGVRYMRSALASVLDGLREHERDQIHIILFFANFEPSDHPAYHEDYIRSLADEVLTYDLPASEIERLREMDARHKGIFDFVYVLNACYKTGAPYVTLLEDDVLAVDGWFDRTMSGLNKVERATDREGGWNDWLYLRLFYTEEYLGWNGESAGEYTLWSLALIISVAIALCCLRALSPRSAPYLPYSLILSVVCICLPMCIVFFFKAGRVTLFPIQHGIRKMEQFGCCSQGLVFNRKQTPDLLAWLKDSPSGHFFDMKVEQYADEHPYLHRWAISPPVIQHMGMKSSTPKEEQKAEVAEKIWSFEFEMYDFDGSLEDEGGGHHKEELV